jgi:hypothetical protein
VERNILIVIDDVVIRQTSTRLATTAGDAASFPIQNEPSIRNFPYYFRGVACRRVGWSNTYG